ncbi:DUF1134 domain-containing protein [Sphingorhabdus sp. M41]|uniref:DUF1134 domain-containing protein n=1 Tax=Sphingorhabdus sp. M41 TaxID=1806885 RepID=UPI00078D5FF5|nr:DUF1134 domain-containing protein [Sphingorhabdus sp. M41]AMO73043.1 hypothetical protein AZE99_15360 [Sphingorhabdus sp. M41]
MLPLCTKKFLGLFAVLALATAPGLSPAFAQVENVDPNDVIDADLAAPDYDGNFESDVSRPTMVEDAPMDSDINADLVAPSGSATSAAQTGGSAAAAVDDSNTYQDDDLIGAAEGVFGKGAKGLAEVIEDILKKQGRPNAYIAGREASGAFIVGLRYGSGKLFHKIEGERPVYWTGPSIGFDFGGNAANTFVLVYNLYNSEDLYQRFPAGEGAAYFIGGFHVSYLRSGDKVLIPVRLGAGLRLGANVGYMKFSKKQQWLPF